MELASKNVNAIGRLLNDPDPATSSLLARQIAEDPSEWLECLEKLSNSNDSTVALRARHLLQTARNEDAQDDFDLLCRFFPENGNLEEALWLLARALDPLADIDSARQKVNTWGRTLLLKTAGAVSNRERVRILAEFMAGDLSFRGNAEDYYNPKNSLLHTVIETRSGLPIALTCIAIFLSHRAGMNVAGINLPGHFIARHGEVFFDPFHKGKILTNADIFGILKCQGLEGTQPCLEPATPLQILRRVLANLAHIYSRPENSDAGLADKISRWMEALQR